MSKYGRKTRVLRPGAVDDGGVNAGQPDGAFVEIPPSRLNPTDATLWDIERDPSLRTTIVAVMVFDRPVRRDRLVNVLAAATRQIPRLRQRVAPSRAGIGPPRWEIDPGFDLVDHVSFAGVADGVDDTIDAIDAIDDAMIATTAETMASTPFDRTRPLWECRYLGGRSGSAALVLKIHHSLTDGVGGIALLDAILDQRRNAPDRDLTRFPTPRPGPPHRSTSDDLDRWLRRGVALPFDVAATAVNTAFHPIGVARGTWAGVRSAARLLAPSAAPLSPLMIGRSGERHVATTDVDLDRLRRAAARHGCTLNHAFFAGTLAGIADYHRTQGAPVARLRVTMPVSIRRGDDPAAGNQWAPVRFVVPTDIADPIERMHAMAVLVRTHRAERALRFSQRLAGAVQVLPPALSSGVVAGMLNGIDLILTDVPGFAEPRYVAGAAVERIYAFAPTAGAALNVGFVSHVGTACIGTLSDVAAVSDPALLQELIATGFEQLLDAAEGAPPSRPSSPDDAPAEPDRAERLSALDAGFLRLERPETPMHIAAVFVLDGAPLRGDDGALRLDDIRGHVDARIRQVPRLTRRLAEVPLGLGRPLWVDDETFDITRHVRHTRVRPPGDRAALLDRSAELLRDPLDRAHPLWELWVVDGLADGRVGLVEKIHHALVDGVAGIDVAATLFDVEPVAGPARPVRRAPVPGPSAAARLLGAAAHQMADPSRVVARTVASVVRSPERAVAQVASAVGAASALVRPGSIAPATTFNRTVGGARRVRAVDVDLDTVRLTGERSGATVNDVVLALVAGGVRHWFLAHDQPPVDVHVLVPVSVRHGPIHAEPGNHVGGVMLALPVGDPDPASRLATISARTQRLKAAHEGEGAAVLLDAFDHVPAAERVATRFVPFQPYVNFVVTNVPGSPTPLHLLGARIETIIPIVPLGPGLGLGVAVLTYAGRLTICVNADPDRCPDVDELAEAIGDGLAALA
jgi:WS/DGAT/MGAT family acyltransferase